VARVAGLNRQLHPGKTLGKVRDMARNLIALALDIEVADIGPIEVTENHWR